MAKLSKLLRKMKKGGASPLTLARAVAGAYTGGVVIDNYTSRHDASKSAVAGSGASNKSRKRVSTDQKIKAQINKLSRAVEISTEQEALQRLTASNEVKKLECIKKRLEAKRNKNLQIIKNLENEK